MGGYRWLCACNVLAGNTGIMSVTKISKALLEMSRITDAVLQPSNAGLTALAGNKLELGPRRLLERIDGFRSIDQILSMSGDVVNVHAALGKLLAMGLVTSDPDGMAAEPQVVAAPPPPSVEKPRVASLARQFAVPAPTPASTRPTVASAPTAAPAVAAPIARAPKAIPSAAAPIAPAVAAKTVPVSTAPATAAKKVILSELDEAKRLLTLEAQHLMGNSAARMQPRIEACQSIAEIYDLIVKFRRHLSRTGTANPDVFLDRMTRGLETARKSKPKSSTTAA